MKELHLFVERVLTVLPREDQARKHQRQWARRRMIVRTALTWRLRSLSTNVNNFNDMMKAMFIDGSHFLHKPYAQHQLQNSVKALLAAYF